MSALPPNELEQVLAEQGVTRVELDHEAGEVRISVLMEAENIVNGPRRAAYGHPRENFSRICDLWNAYLRGRASGPGSPITPEDHALMMVLLKVARLQETPDHRDSVVDICGYAGTYEFLLER